MKWNGLVAVAVCALAQISMVWDLPWPEHSWNAVSLRMVTFSVGFLTLAYLIIMEVARYRESKANPIPPIHTARGVYVYGVAKFGRWGDVAIKVFYMFREMTTLDIVRNLAANGYVPLGKVALQRLLKQNPVEAEGVVSIDITTWVVREGKICEDRRQVWLPETKFAVADEDSIAAQYWYYLPRDYHLLGVAVDSFMAILIGSVTISTQHPLGGQLLAWTMYVLCLFGWHHHLWWVLGQGRGGGDRKRRP